MSHNHTSHTFKKYFANVSTIANTITHTYIKSKFVNIYASTHLHTCDNKHMHTIDTDMLANTYILGTIIKPTSTPHIYKCTYTHKQTQKCAHTHTTKHVCAPIRTSSQHKPNTQTHISATGNTHTHAHTQTHTQCFNTTT